MASTSEGRIYEGRRNEGEHVRLIDVLPPAKSLSGLIDRRKYFQFGKEKARANARDIIDRINRGAAAHYGHSLPMFIEAIIENPKEAQEACGSYFTDFRSRHASEAKTPLQGRLLDEFGYCYAAGCLAIDFKILPWTKQSLREVIGCCWIDTLTAIPDVERDTCALAHKIMQFVLHEANLTVREGSVRQQDFNNADGVRVERVEMSSPFILIPHKRLRSNFPDEALLNAALSLLKQKGILRGEKGRKVYTDLVMHPDGSKRRYCRFDVGRAEAFHEPE